MSEATPRPWFIVDESKAVHRWVIAHGEGDSIADCAPVGPWMTPEEADANAALIVRAVNNHEALLSALESAADELVVSHAQVADPENREGWDNDDIYRVWHRACTAIADAKPGGGS